MTSAINTGTIDVNYPVPGVNNNSQQFRDNFSGISNNLETAATEITALQSNVLLKAPLAGTVLDNDMSNGIIKNAQTLGFRASTYDLGNNLSGTVNIDLTLGDVQTGTATGSTTLTFSKWPLAPGNPTYATVQVILAVTADQTINLPATVTLGTATIEGYSAGVITVPAGVTRLHFQFNTLDCGTTVEIVPLDRPRQATQLYNATPPTLSTGTGIKGQIAYDSSYVYVCVATNTWKRSPLTTW